MTRLNLVIGIDFDGTLQRHDSQGKPYLEPELVSVISEVKANYLVYGVTLRHKLDSMMKYIDDLVEICSVKLSITNAEVRAWIEQRQSSLLTDFIVQELKAKELKLTGISTPTDLFIEDDKQGTYHKSIDDFMKMVYKDLEPTLSEILQAREAKQPRESFADKLKEAKLQIKDFYYKNLPDKNVLFETAAIWDELREESGFLTKFDWSKNPKDRQLLKIAKETKCEAIILVDDLDTNLHMEDSLDYDPLRPVLISDDEQTVQAYFVKYNRKCPKGAYIDVCDIIEKITYNPFSQITEVEVIDTPTETESEERFETKKMRSPEGEKAEDLSTKKEQLYQLINYLSRLPVSGLKKAGKKECENFYKGFKFSPGEKVQQNIAKDTYSAILRLNQHVRIRVLREYINVRYQEILVKATIFTEVKLTFSKTKLLKLASSDSWRSKRRGLSSFFGEGIPTGITHIRSFLAKKNGDRKIFDLIDQLEGQLDSSSAGVLRQEQTRAFYELIIAAFGFIKLNESDPSCSGSAMLAALDEIVVDFTEKWKMELSSPTKTSPTTSPQSLTK